MYIYLYMHIYIYIYIWYSEVSYIHTYTQCRGWIENGASSIAASHHNTLPPLCREALLLYRTGVAPLWINEVNVTRNASVNRFKRTCEFCMHVYNCSFIHDAFHIIFECPLYLIRSGIYYFNVYPQLLSVLFLIHNIHYMNCILCYYVLVHYKLHQQLVSIYLVQ